MTRFLLVLTLIFGIVVAGFFTVRMLVPPARSAAAPEVASSLEYIRQIGDLAVLRASVKEIVTTKVGQPRWFSRQGKLAIICHFDIRYKYDLRKAAITAGERPDGTRFCTIRLPKHEYEISTKEISFYDEQDGTWLGIPQKTPPDERTRALDAGRAQAEAQAKAFLTDMEGEIQSSARATLGQISRAFGFKETRFEFEK